MLSEIANDKSKLLSLDQFIVDLKGGEVYLMQHYVIKLSMV